MKAFIEADFTKGRGAIHWEGVTRRRLRGIFATVFTLAAAAVFFASSRM
jgi:hypothetical protein